MPKHRKRSRDNMPPPDDVNLYLKETRYMNPFQKTASFNDFDVLREIVERSLDDRVIILGDEVEWVDIGPYSEDTWKQ